VSAAIEARGVEKRYGSLVAVADLSFAAQAGEILGVLGPNGAGKTTAVHTGGINSRPAEYERRVVGFFDKNLLKR
jgi:ABC-2 type transport system ATP-binding protein